VNLGEQVLRNREWGDAERKDARAAIEAAKARDEAQKGWPFVPLAPTFESFVFNFSTQRTRRSHEGHKIIPACAKKLPRLSASACSRRRTASAAKERRAFAIV